MAREKYVQKGSCWPCPPPQPHSVHFFCLRIVPTRNSSQCNTKTLKTTAINYIVPGHDCRARHTMRVNLFTHVPNVHHPQSVHSGHTNFPFQCGMCVETSSSVSLRVTRSSRKRSKPVAKASSHHIVSQQPKCYKDRAIQTQRRQNSPSSTGSSGLLTNCKSRLNSFP